MSWKFVNSELDATYSQPIPEASMLAGDELPISEFELREHLAHWLISSFVPANSLSLLDKLTNKADYEQKLTSLEKANQSLIALISDDKYKAALLRIITIMPNNVPQKQYLMNNILTITSVKST